VKTDRLTRHDERLRPAGRCSNHEFALPTLHGADHRATDTARLGETVSPRHSLLSERRGKAAKLLGCVESFRHIAGSTTGPMSCVLNRHFRSTLPDNERMWASANLRPPNQQARLEDLPLVHPLRTNVLPPIGY